MQCGAAETAIAHEDFAAVEAGMRRGGVGAEPKRQACVVITSTSFTDRIDKDTRCMIATNAVQAHTGRAINCGSYAEQVVDVKELLRCQATLNPVRRARNSRDRFRFGLLCGGNHTQPLSMRFSVLVQVAEHDVLRRHPVRRQPVKHVRENLNSTHTAIQQIAADRNCRNEDVGAAAVDDNA